MPPYLFPLTEHTISWQTILQTLLELICSLIYNTNLMTQNAHRSLYFQTHLLAQEFP